MSMKDNIKRRAKERAKKGGDGIFKVDEEIEFWKPQKGYNLFDILPYEITDKNNIEGIEPGDLWYRKLFYLHWSVGPTGKTVICPKSVGKPCPICEEYYNLLNDDDVDDEVTSALKPKERELFNVIVHDDDDEEIKLFQFSTYLFGQLLEEEVIQSEEEVGDFAELEGGLTIKARFKTTKLGSNKFLECDRIDFLERNEDYDESILDDVVNLDEILIVHSYEELKQVLYGMGDVDPEAKVDDEEEEEEDEKPKKKKRTRKKKSKSESKEEEEEEDLNYDYSKSDEEEPEKEEEPEEEEEEPKPKKRKRRSRKKVEKEPEEEEKEEEEPKKKTTKRRRRRR